MTASSSPSSVACSSVVSTLSERAGHLEFVEKFLEVADLTGLDTHADDESSVFLESWLDGGDADVLRQRLLELRQQVGPRECPHFDDRLGFSRRRRDDLEIFGVHLRADADGIAFQLRGIVLRLHGAGAQRALTGGQLQQTDHVEHREQDDERRERAERRPAPRGCCRTVASKDWCAASGGHRFPPRAQQHADQR